VYNWTNISHWNVGRTFCVFPKFGFWPNIIHELPLLCQKKCYFFLHSVMQVTLTSNFLYVAKFRIWSASVKILKKIYHQQSIIVVTFFHSFLTAACICCCPYWKLGSEGIWNVNAVFSKNDSTTHISCCKPQVKQWLWRPSSSLCCMVSVVLVYDD